MGQATLRVYLSSISWGEQNLISLIGRGFNGLRAILYHWPDQVDEGVINKKIFQFLFGEPDSCFKFQDSKSLSKDKVEREEWMYLGAKAKICVW